MGNRIETGSGQAQPRLANSTLNVCLMVEPSPFSYISGYATRFQKMLHFLDDHGDRVEIITTTAVSSERPNRYWNFPIHYTSGVGFPWYKGLTLSVDFRLKAMRVLHRFRPDILHVSSPGWMVFPAVFYSRLMSVPLVLSYHTHLPVYVRQYLPRFRPAERIVWWLIKICHNFADLTLVTSPQIVEEFVRHRIRHRIRRVDIWRKGIDTEEFHPNHSNKIMRHTMSDGNPDEFLMVYVGRLSVEKRIVDLKGILDALPSKTRLCIVGTGPLEEELRRLFEGTKTVFTGQLQGERLSQAFASADCMVFPSDSETLGFVAFESMASGTPVVAACAGGIPDMIENAVTSFLVPPGNIEEYVDKINMLRVSEARSEMGRLARDEATRWTWEESMSNLRDVQYPQAMLNYQQRLSVLIGRWLLGQLSIPASMRQK